MVDIECAWKAAFFDAFPEILTVGGERMEHGFPEYLGLTDLLDQDLSAYEFFQTLSPELQTQLRREDQISSFEELQKRSESD